MKSVSRNLAILMGIIGGTALVAYLEHREFNKRWKGQGKWVFKKDGK